MTARDFRMSVHAHPKGPRRLADHTVSNLPSGVLARIATEGFRPGHPGAGGARSEAEYQGLRLPVPDAHHAARYRVRVQDAEACISIGDRGEAAPRLSARFAAVLRVEFKDTGAYASYLDSGGEHPGTISAAQASVVAAFVLRHRARQRLVLHCTAGISRSRSMAAIAGTLRRPFEFTAVNDDVYRALCHALRASFAV